MLSRSSRLLLYLLVLLILSSFLNFYRLGERAFYGDEATFASITRNVVKSGDWFHLYTYDPAKPYAAKPPLYFWLSAAVKGLIGDWELASRWWSAAFGIGSVLLTCVLASFLFSAETGFAAGLMMATNQRFLLAHGARHGTMDTAVTCFALAAIILAWKTPEWRRPSVAWIGVGVATGMISITKGLPLGFLTLGLISLHWMVLGTGRGWARIGLPAVAGLASIPVFATWFVLQWVQHGAFVEHVHLMTFLGSLDPDHLQGPLFYLWAVSFSSRPFVLFVPAMLLAAVLSVRGIRRREYGLLTIFGGGWVAVFSLARAKLAWYAFPAFPLIAIAITGVSLLPVQVALDRRLAARRQRQVVALALAALALVAVAPEALHIVTRAIPEKIGTFRDLRWEVYQSADVGNHPEIRFVILDHPEQEIDEFWWHYERFEIAGETRTEDVDLVLRLVTEDGPIVVALARTAPAYLVRLVHSRFEGEGVRYQNRLHIVFVRGLELDLPESITVSAERCGPLDPPFNERELNQPAIEFVSGWSDRGRGRWSSGDRAVIRFALDRPGSQTLWMRARTYHHQRVELELNGHALTPIPGDGKSRTYSRPLPESVLAQNNELVFRLPDARLPAHTEGPEPRNRLGILIRSLRISEDQVLE
jgi:4-amino-4-deoxy-L-arabinose transferase-like glycosyltransferase